MIFYLIYTREIEKLKQLYEFIKRKCEIVYKWVGWNGFTCSFDYVNDYDYDYDYVYDYSFDYDFDYVYDYSFAFDFNYAYGNRKGPHKQSLVEK